MEPPDPEAVTREIDENPDLGEAVAAIGEYAGEPREAVARAVLDAMGERFGVAILSAWEGFARFCRATLGMEPALLMRAWGLGLEDPAAEVRAACPDAAVDEAKAAEWAERFGVKWREHFKA